MLQDHFDHGVPEPDLVAAYAVYYRMWGSRTMGLATKILRPRFGGRAADKADEVTQDAFVRLWKYDVLTRRFDPSIEGGVGRLFKITRNRCNDVLTGKEPGPGPVEPPDTTDPRAQDRVRARILLERGIRIARGEPDHRYPGWRHPVYEEIVRLTLAGKTTAEIATELDLAVGTVFNYRSAAMSLLEKIINDILRGDL